jgi:DNA-binding response OmpR family regulator
VPDKNNVLVVNLEASEFAKVAPLLDREEFEVDRFPRAAMALELLGQVTFDVLLVGYPLPDIGARTFLSHVRDPAGQNLTTPLLLIAAQDELESAAELIGYGANRVVGMEETAERLQAEVTRLLEVAPRRDVRAMVRLEIRVDDGQKLAMGQTENLSRSGMLVRAGEAYAVGAVVEFEFFLGTDPSPIHGKGRVVRHTTPGREQVSGMGILFESFEKDGKARLERFLAGR